jgi:hypothetical protein
VNDALRLAKESGEFDGEPGKPGEPGVSPHIGANGNWFIGEMDTGVPARVDTDEFASKQEVTKLSGEIANLAGKTGWSPNKYICTDAEGNLVEKNAPTGGGSVSAEYDAETGDLAITATSGGAEYDETTGNLAIGG